LPLGLLDCDHGAGVVVAIQSADARDLGQGVAQHFNPLGGEHVGREAHSGDVAAGAGKAGDQPGSDRVSDRMMMMGTVVAAFAPL
jgi:hypothetical protein